MIDVAELFPGRAAGPYFDTATVSLGNVRAAGAITSAVEDWSRGTFDWAEAEEAGEDCRTLFATLIGGSPTAAAVVGSASVAAGLISSQLPDAGPGQNVVVPGGEFASNYFPWMILANRGYEVRRVDPKTGELTVDRFAEHVDGGTVVVASSLVQSSTGYRIDAVALAAVAHEVGARLVLDGSQGLGAVAFDVGKGVDAVFGCDQKFLLGTRGLGYLWVRDDWLESFRPLFPGWKAADDPLTSFYGPKMKLSDSASRLDHAVSWFNALANRESLGILAEVGMQEIAAHTAGLASVLRSRLEDIGLRPLPTGPLPSPILTIPVPHAEATRARLAESSIRAAVRAGRLRVSLHLYNTAEDIETLVAALR